MGTLSNTERLKSLNTDKLIDVVKNYRQYGYDDSFRNAAIEILKERDIDIDLLKATGNFDNRSYDIAQSIGLSFMRNSKIAFVFYGIFLLSLVVTPIIFTYFGGFGTIAFVINITSFLLYLFFLIKSLLVQIQFYKVIGKPHGIENSVAYLALGMPLYIFTYFYYTKEIKEAMNLVN